MYYYKLSFPSFDVKGNLLESIVAHEDDFITAGESVIYLHQPHHVASDARIPQGNITYVSGITRTVFNTLGCVF